MLKIHTTQRGRKTETHYHRTFNFIIKQWDEYWNSPVVYIIFIGDKFYIGQAVRYSRRASSHKALISNSTWNPNSKNFIKLNKSEDNIRDYLLANPEIEDIVFDILEVCSGDKDHLNTSEELWFADICRAGLSEYCLNHYGVHHSGFGYANLEPYRPGSGIDHIL